ncbi:MAG: integrase core domain-containing protein [Pseudolabrys sp.]
MFKSRRRLEAENLFLRHQLNIALRRAPAHLRLHCSDRALYDRPISPGSPWQNGIVERLIGTLHRECLDQMVTCGEGAPSTDSFRLCSVLQSSADTLGITERCPVTSSRPTVWRHCRHSDLGRVTSSIRPDMIFGKDRSYLGKRR